MMRHPSASAFAFLALLALALSACVGPGGGDDERTRVLVAFGDSVAAGHGLGDARGYPSNPSGAFPNLVGESLGLPVHNMAISGACSLTRELDAGASANCTRSILE